MNTYAKLFIVAAVALAACNSSSETSGTATDSTTVAASTTPEATTTETATTATGDQSTPEGVAMIIFNAAKSGDYSMLSGICDAGADGDSRSICDLSASDEAKKNEFKQWFEKGAVAGAATIDGTNATLPITFGPDGTKQEELKMTQVDGKWLLVSF